MHIIAIAKCCLCLSLALPHTVRLRVCLSVCLSVLVCLPHGLLMTSFHSMFECLQVSEHASWSSLYYGRIIKAALASVGRLAAQLHS